ncbi:bestrophin-like domain [Pseudaminobacter sp. NGMCC 1.201702]|uniref:bestrophin-like domain n=1 Tax=Pseudaminobacter sp. NGMCC 1.201702 TaxID=3391825 RepID=UPI0039F042BB
MDEIFSLSAPALLLLFSVFGGACLAASMALLSYFRRRAECAPETIPVAAFVGTIATAWALSLGFAAADVWSVKAQAEQVASEERSTIGRLAGMASADALNIPQLLEALRAYKRAVKTGEWERSGNRTPSTEVDRALQQIRLAIIGMAMDKTPASLMGKMTQDFDELQDARNKRLAIGSTSVSKYKWYLVLFLTFLSMVAIAAVHADRPIAGRNALSIFTVAAVVSLWILALHASPYAGAARIEFDAVHFPLPV